MIKSKTDLLKIKQKEEALLKMRESHKRFKIIVSRGENCRAVFDEILVYLHNHPSIDCVAYIEGKSPKKELDTVVTIYDNALKTTYVKVTKEAVESLLNVHLKNQEVYEPLVYRGEVC